MKKQRYLVLDYETRSKVDLKKVGASEYARHPSTEIICCAWRYGTKEELKDAPTHLWAEPLDAAWAGLIYALERPDVMLIAHNAFFEQVITHHVVKRHIPPERWICTAAMAAALALPRKLADAAKALGLPVQKDMEGHRLMLKHSKPRRPSKKYPNGGWYEDPDERCKIYDYCKQDIAVEVDLFLRLPGLNPFERKIWVLDQKINHRGVLVDRELIATAQKMIVEHSKALDEEVTTLTNYAVTSVSQRDKVLSWLSSEGVDLPDLQQKTVEDAVSGGTIKGDALRVLEMRLSGAKTSTAKYAAFEQRSRSDGRLRDILVYHAASTGRWGGSGVQLQNLPRALIDDTDLGAEIIKEGCFESLKLFYGSPMDVLSSCLRSVLVAPKGRVFDIADYAGVEARVLFWVAKHEAGLQAFRDGRDLYKELAANIFGVALKDVTSDQRFFGKTAILGCLAEGTLVITDNGLKAIEKVTNNDKLWDGDTWVSHEGVLSKGLQETQNVLGVWLTPDHQVLCGTQWLETQYVVQDENILYQALVRGAANLRLRDMFRALVAGLNPLLLNAVAGAQSIPSAGTTSKNSKAPGVIYALRKRLLIRESCIGGMQRFFQTMSIVNGCLIGFLRLFNVAAKLIIRCMFTMAGAESEFTNRGPQIGVLSLNIYSLCLAGINRSLRLIELTTKKVISRVILGLLRVWRIWQIDDDLKTLKRKSPTYDIVLSGPKNRFAVLSAAGPVIVHNCGFGLGPKKFMAACQNQGKDLSLELAEATIKTYRSTHSPVVQLWSNINLAAISATENPGTKYTVNRTSWWKKGRILWCQLPSGRRLAYYDPSVVIETNQWGYRQAVLYHYGINTLTKQWEKQSTYGGRLVENCVQAIARDLLAEAMIRITDTGLWQIPLHVHDELVGERDEGAGSNEEFCRLMAEVPTWAEGLPIKVEGWSGKRYRK